MSEWENISDPAKMYSRYQIPHSNILYQQNPLNHIGLIYSQDMYRVWLGYLEMQSNKWKYHRLQILN